jgi:hypothetical protein
MDTRWRVVRLYDASVLTVIIANVGIPISSVLVWLTIALYITHSIKRWLACLILICPHLLLNPTKDLPCGQSVPDIAIIIWHVCDTSSYRLAAAPSLSKSEISSDIEGVVISRLWQPWTRNGFILWKNRNWVNQGIAKGWSVFRRGRNYHWEMGAMARRLNERGSANRNANSNEFAWIFP